MKKRKIYGLAIVVLALSITLGSFLATENPYYDIYKKYEASLNTQEQMQLENFVDHMYYGMPDKYVEFIRANAVNKKVVEIILSEGYYTEYYQEFKDAGFVSAEYELPKNSAKVESEEDIEVLEGLKVETKITLLILYIFFVSLLIIYGYGLRP